MVNEKEIQAAAQRFEMQELFFGPVWHRTKATFIAGANWVQQQLEKRENRLQELKIVCGLCCKTHLRVKHAVIYQDKLICNKCSWDLTDDTPDETYIAQPLIDIRHRRPPHFCPGPNCNRPVNEWISDGIYMKHF